MNITPASGIKFFLLAFSLLTSACSVDKLEARLQADPQCKPVMNPKTGALMPCPGSDKTFYRSIPALNAVTSQPTQTPETIKDTDATQIANPMISIAPSECKPSLHPKSGSLMPCPAP